MVKSWIERLEAWVKGSNDGSTLHERPSCSMRAIAMTIRLLTTTWLTADAQLPRNAYQRLLSLLKRHRPLI